MTGVHKAGFRCDSTRPDTTAASYNLYSEQTPSRQTGENKRENVNPAAGSSHLVVPDDRDVRRAAARAPVVGDVVVFGTRDPAGGEEERVELHAQRLPSHVLHRQLAADRDKFNSYYPARRHSSI